MRVDVYSTYTESIEKRLRNTTVVVIDVLRATTSAVEAIENGVKYIIPVSSLEEAVAISRARGGHTLLAGERGGLKIDGFDLGNSPFDFNTSTVGNKVVIMSTTNGTGVILKAGNIGETWIGCLRNRKTLCEKIMTLGKDVSIICAGSESMFAADDIFAAGAYVSKLRDMLGEIAIEMGDLAMVAESFYYSARSNQKLLTSMEHYTKLVELGMKDDIDYCFKADTSNALAVMKDSITIVNALK